MNSPAEFLRALKVTLNKIKAQHGFSSQIINYMDGIALLSKGRDSHSRDLQVVLQFFGRGQWRMKSNKCELFRSEIDFLGYRLNKHGWMPTQGTLVGSTS